MKRTPLKRGKLRTKTTSTDPKVRERLKQQTEKRAKMMDFLVKLFIDVPLGERRCQSCGKELNFPPRSYYFDHLLEKSKYPELAMEKDNIFLCCLACHSLKTDGHPTEKHKEAIEKAKERFKISI